MKEGSGVLIITQKQVQGTSITCFVFFQEKRTGDYTDAGGTNNQTTSEAQALQELREESCGMFWFHLKSKIPKVQVIALDGSKYTCLVLNVIVKNRGRVDARGIDEYVYYRNKQVIDRQQGLAAWKETKNIAFVDVKEIMEKILEMNETTLSVAMKDIYGRKITISKRAIDAVTKFLKKGKVLDVEVSLKVADVPGIQFYSN